jgi:hypothetical protein
MAVHLLLVRVLKLGLVLATPKFASCREVVRRGNKGGYMSLLSLGRYMLRINLHAILLFEFADESRIP